MSETLALARLAIQRQRISLMVISAVVLFGVVSTFALAAGSLPNDQNFALVALSMAMFPAVVWTFALFVFGSDRDMLLGESGYLHWMLRMPIADWKLALVPVTLKTVWTSALWIVFALTLSAVTEARVYLIGPAIGFSTVGIWLMVLTWRPFTNGWWRLAAFMTCGLVLWTLLTGVLIELEKSDPTSAWWLKPAVNVGTYGMFALGIWMSVRAVRLARTNSYGLIPEKGKTRTATSERAGDGTVRRHIGPRTALVWHDLAKSREIIRWFAVLGVIPAIVLFTVFMPFSAVGFVFVMTVFSYFGFGASTLVLDRNNKGKTVLPPYLGASPLGTAAIAWTRLLTIITIMAAALSLGLVIFALWTLFPGNRANWNTWANQMAEATGVASAGVGIATALTLGTMTFVIGRGTAYIWPAMSGRSWVQFVAIVIGSIAYSVPIGVVIAWFLRQTSWESSRENALYWLTFLPWPVAALLLLKVALTGVCVWQLRSLRLASDTAIATMTIGWLLVTCLIATTIHLSLPYAWATLPWCFAAVAISTPLARLLVLPISLHFGRHQ